MSKLFSWISLSSVIIFGLRYMIRYMIRNNPEEAIQFIGNLFVFTFTNAVVLLEWMLGVFL